MFRDASAALSRKRGHLDARTRSPAPVDARTSDSTGDRARSGRIKQMTPEIP
ncbi:hypothetical protein I546_3494 [Mycobacterium kansasii 732]|nr:hypothetical protein I546_3494 [Mycobacterium kansasii 732]